MSGKVKEAAVILAAIGAVGVMIAMGTHLGYQQGAASEREMFLPTHTETVTIVMPSTTAVPEPAGLKDRVDPGYYRVGVDIAEGVWVTPGADGECYWAQFSGEPDENPWWMNHTFQGPTRVAVRRGDFVQFVGCSFALER